MRKFYVLLLAFAICTLVKAQTVATYAFAQSINTYSPISGTALTSGTGWDDNVQNVTIPFSFTFNGAAYTACNINTNGYITFGSTAPSSTSYTPISSTTGYAGAVSAFGRDLINNGVAVSYTTIGSSPSRIFIVQWNNARRYNSGSVTGDVMNFQIRLYETSNIAEIMFGTCTATNTTALTHQVGLRGATNSDYNNRTSSTTWTGTTAGSSNSATVSSSNTILPPSGLTFSYTPGVPCSGTPLSAILPNTSSACTGSAATISATNLPSGVTGITYQWEESPDGITGWVSAVGGSGSTTSTYTTPAITGSKYYRLIVTCTVSSQSSTSNVAAVSPVNCQFDITKSSASFSSIAATGSSMSGWRNGNSTDDNLSTAQSIGFNFNYKGNNYTQFSVSTNGYLTFNVGTSATGGGSGTPYSFDNTYFTNTAGTLNSLAPFYEDLVIQGNPGTAAGLASGLKYQLSGSPGSQVLTIEWIGMETFSNAGPNLNFQIKLYEGTNTIEFVYGTMEGFNGTANYTYTYSLGVNAPTLSATPTVNELQTQQIENVQNFSATPRNTLASPPACNTRYTFTPGAYSGAAATPGAPANDNPAGALDVGVNTQACTSLCGTYFSSKNATATASIPVCSATTPGTPDDDVWFKFTATNAQQTITVRGSGGFDPVVQLLTDAYAAVNCLNATGTGFTETLTATGLTVNSVYYVRVYHGGTSSGTSGDFSICVNSPAVPPANDDPCGATNLTPSSTCSPYSDNTANSTTSILNATTTTVNGVTTPTCAGAGTTVSDVWFKFTATSTLSGVTVAGVSGFDVAVQVYNITSGSCGTNDLVLSSIGCGNGTSTGGTEQISFPSTVGSTYYIRIYRHPSGTTGTPINNSQFSICILNPIPACTTNSSPTNGATNVSTTPTLSWSTAFYATSYDVYLGTSLGTATLIGNSTTTSYTVTTPLSISTQYFWYVVPKNENGSATGCDASNSTSFTTTSIACGAPTSVSVGTITTTLASISFTSVGSSFVIEYGPTGFTPGTGNTPGTNGTIVTGSASPVSISGLTAATSYDVYVRQDCSGSGNGYSLSSNVATFTTAVGPPDCITAVALTACTPVTASILAGTGAWSFAGTYPANSNGFSTPGREIVYRFTPAATGVYYLEITAAPGTGYIDYFFKAASNGCSATGWVGIDDNNSVGKDAIGMLQAGVEYYILLDAESTTAAPVQTFQICQATTVAPSTLNSCISAVSLPGAIPANSPKVEYVIDAAGNLIAGLDFSTVTNAVGTVTTSYYVNGNALRKDGNAREYLDRNFTITTGTPPATPANVTLYFLNTELQTLINDPNDGIADVSSISDLNVTKTSQTCPTSGNVQSGGSLLMPNATGALDANVSFITLSVPSFSTFYLHGGNAVLPANLLTFSGSRQGSSNNLKWTVAQENDVQVYQIERSEDGSRWTTAGSVNSLGNTTLQRSYSFADNNVSGLKQYYRLRQVDRNGAAKLSNIVIISGVKPTVLTLNGLFPNPTVSTLSVLVDAPAKDKVTLVVMDAVGRIIKSQKASVDAGSNTLSVNVTGLSQGSYLLKVTCEAGCQTVTGKFVKE